MQDTLRRLKRSELQAGMSLPGPVLDKSGTVIFEKGQALTSQLLEALPDRVYTNTDWPKRRSVQSVVDDYFQRMGISQPIRCQRRRARREWRTQTSIIIEQRDDTGVHRCKMQVITTDLSTMGFGFHCMQQVSPGARVFLSLGTHLGRKTVAGVVRNCMLVEGVRHRVGVEFIEVER